MMGSCKLLRLNTSGRGLVKLLGEPEWMTSEDYESQKMRVAQWEKVTKLLAQETAKHTRQMLFTEGQALVSPSHQL